jgi:hypothetical protein
MTTCLDRSLRLAERLVALQCCRNFQLFTANRQFTHSIPYPVHYLVDKSTVA